MAHLCVLCLVILMLLRMFIAALRSPSGKGLNSWLLLVMFIVFLFFFPCGILGQVWYLIVSFSIFVSFLTFIDITKSSSLCDMKQSI